MAHPSKSVLLVVPIVLAAVAGCGKSTRTTRVPEVSTGLEDLAAGTSTAPSPAPMGVTEEGAPPSVEALLQQNAIEYERIMREAGATPAPAGEAAPTAPGAPRIARAEPAPGTEAGAEPPGPIEAAAAPPPETPPSPPEVVIQGESRKTLDERIEEASILLVDLLRQQAAASPKPARSYFALAALEALRPGSFPQVVTEDSTDASPLSASERTCILALRDLVSALSGDGARDPVWLADTIDEIAGRLENSRPMRITHAALCRRVDGFGSYTPFASSRFVAGKAHRVIVYVEVEHFANRPISEGDAVPGGAPANPGDAYAVDLSQELNLYLNADRPLWVWKRAEERWVDTSRNKRNDFFVRQIVDLPANLTIGAYRLKVTMRDKTSGAMAEQVIPIEIVADPLAAAGERDGR